MNRSSGMPPPAHFVSSADKIKAALLANANESGSQRGLLLPWLFGGEDDATQKGIDNSFSQLNDSLSLLVPDSMSTSFPNGLDRAAEITQMYKKLKGIESLYSWQSDCLDCDAFRERKNLLIAMPTSAGKTLVAEIVMLREIMIYNRAVMLVLPYVSLVQEKVRGLIPLSLRFGFSVEEYAGGRGTFPPPIRRRRQSLYVATIEKASSLVSAFIDPTLHGSKKSSVRDIGLVIVDEVHMIGDGERGAVLEAALIKLRAGFPNAQIVTMSATVGNLNELAACFSADIFYRDFRPVPLHEYVMCNKTLFTFVVQNGSGRLEQIAETTAEKKSSAATMPGQNQHPALQKLDKNTLAQIKRIDPDDVFGLVGDIIFENKQCLVFCATRRAAESAAMLIAKILSTLSACSDEDKAVRQRRAILLAQMMAENEGQCCPILQRTLPVGIAYHHAGLIPEERFSVEQGYMEGLITVLCCTSTLAAGVNLPARRVVIRSPFVAASFLTADRYRQMAGRAGRAKLDTLGQSVIMCTQNDLPKVAAMMAAPLAPCISCLPLVLPSLLLELSCIGIADSLQSASRIISSFSLWNRQRQSDDNTSVEDELTKVANDLVQAGLLYSANNENMQASEGNILRTTSFGRAAMAANLTPQAANSLLSDLKQCQAMLTLASPLHLLYLTIPAENVPELIESIDFSILAREINHLQQDADLAALKLLNLSESYVTRMRGTGYSTLSLSSLSTTPSTVAAALPYGRLQLALALRAIWYGANYWEAASRLGLSRGSVYQLMSTATAYAHAAHRFAAQISELWPLSDLMLSLNRRLLECPLSDLSELLNVPGVQHGRAKQLARAGYTNLASLATVDPVQLAREIEHLPRRTAVAIVEAAQLALRENVRQLQDAADSIIEDTLTAAFAEPKASQIPATAKNLNNA